MDKLLDNGFEERLKTLIQCSDAEKRQREDAEREKEELYEANITKFKEVAKRIQDEIILPRMEKLKEYFPFIEEPDVQPEWGRIFLFPYTKEYDCRGILDIHILRAKEDATRLSCKCTISILPKSQEYEPHGELIQSVDNINLPQIEEFVEGKILDFVDTYLKYRQ